MWGICADCLPMVLKENGLLTMCRSCSGRSSCSENVTVVAVFPPGHSKRGTRGPGTGFPLFIFLGNDSQLFALFGGFYNLPSVQTVHRCTSPG